MMHYRNPMKRTNKYYQQQKMGGPFFTSIFYDHEL